MTSSISDWGLTGMEVRSQICDHFLFPRMARALTSKCVRKDTEFQLPKCSPSFHVQSSLWGSTAVFDSGGALLNTASGL